MNDIALQLAEAQRSLRLRFRNQDLLAEAFVHRSVLNEAGAEGVSSNERLEFLGDAILGAIVAEELFRRHPNAPEGEMTDLRAALVQRSALAGAARRLDLGRWLRLGKGEILAGGRSRDANLSRVFEAVVGAIYLDKGYKRTANFVLRTLRPDFERLDSGYVADAKTRLQWLAQGRWQQAPVYETVSAEGPDHAKTFLVRVVVGGESLGEGSGTSRRAAEQAAAGDALSRLEAQPA